MGRSKTVSDDTIIAAVAALRDERGSCTTPMLAREVGLSPSALHARVKVLIAAGALASSAGAVGSLRVPARGRGAAV